MRQVGRLTHWKDDQGYGYISPDDGSGLIFVNLQSFTNSQQRPHRNDIVRYTAVSYGNDRARAEDVEFVRATTENSDSSIKGPGILAFAVFFILLVAERVWEGKLPVSVFGLYMFASAIAFVIYRHEKAMATSHPWKISDSALHLCSLVGGWPGAALADKMVHHEPQKMSFRVIYWSTVVLNSFVFFWLLSTSGSAQLRSILNSLKIH